jgi:MFS family permease
MKATGRAVAYGRYPLFALAMTVMLEQGERLSLSQALDGMRDEFGATDTALGGIAFAMAVVGALGAIPFGWLADRRRRVTLLTAAMAIWTVFIGLHALAPTLLFIYLVRLPLGVVEANGPAAVSLISDYYPVQRRARVIGFYQLGAAVGGGIGLVLSGFLIDLYDWRAAFWMWIPFGVVVVIVMSRAPEPARGAQDLDFATDQHGTGDGLTFEGELVPDFDLPPPQRVSSVDYATLDNRGLLREIVRIRSMWFAVLALTVSQTFLAALGYWGPDYFKQAHGLSESEAGAYAIVVGAGSGLGIVLGGQIADRLLRRGVVNARVFVPAIAMLAGFFVLLPALLVDELTLATPLFFAGGFLLTVPVAPADALMTDVVVAPLRGRAASARSLVRSVAAASPLLVGALSDLWTLEAALAMLSPLLAVGGLVMLIAARTYPSDLAFVMAEAERTGVKIPS